MDYSWPKCCAALDHIMSELQIELAIAVLYHFQLQPAPHVTTLVKLGLQLCALNSG